MLLAVQALALTGAEVLRNPGLRLEMRKEFKAQTRKQP